MPILKRTLSWAALVLGGLGAIVCTIAAFCIWLADARVTSATNSISARLEETLVAVQDGVQKARQRIDDSKPSSGDLRRAIEEWAKLEAVEQVRSRLNLEQRADQLASTIDLAGGWLSSATASVEVVRQTVELANSGGRDLQTDRIDALLAELVALQTQVQEVAQQVADVRDRIQTGGDATALQLALEQAVPLAMRIIASLDVVDARFSQFDARLEAVRSYVQSARDNTLSWIHIIAISLSAVAVWMFLGQVVLCWHGRAMLRRRVAAAK